MVWRWYSGVANTVVENSCVFFQFLNAVVTVSSDDPQSRLAVDRHACWSTWLGGADARCSNASHRSVVWWYHFPLRGGGAQQIGQMVSPRYSQVIYWNHSMCWMVCRWRLATCMSSWAFCQLTDTKSQVADSLSTMMVNWLSEWRLFLQLRI